MVDISKVRYEISEEEIRRAYFGEFPEPTDEERHLIALFVEQGFSKDEAYRKLKEVKAGRACIGPAKH